MDTQRKSTLPNSSSPRINTLQSALEPSRSSAAASSSSRTTTEQQSQQRKQQQQQQTSVKTKKQRKRCRRNRKLRRFQKKCIKRGLNKEEIRKLIDEHNRKQIVNQLPNQNIEQMEASTTTKNKDMERKLNKRKRIPTSTSLRSIAQGKPKKMKKKNASFINITSIKPNYRLPKYLKKAPNLLFQSLRLQLKHKLKKKNQQRFLHHRLQLIDQQYRLNLHRNLWQSYLTLGSEHQTWTVSFLSLYSIEIIKILLNKQTESNIQIGQNART